MAQAGWRTAWLNDAQDARRLLWRGVEAQHRVATMRLVDTLAEQDLLEQLLEAGKPPLPPAAQSQHYLLSTPFRYAPPWPSRFRRSDHPGAWYGADNVLTVAAELAHWRWRFLMDAADLSQASLLTEHTFFQARFVGRELDLCAAPWSRLRATWRHTDDYVPCHALADAARAHAPPIDAIRYESARREGGLCQAVFAPATLSLPSPRRQQNWACKTTRERVFFVHESDSIEFPMAG
ncbi:MAG: RES domain-containing protein [Lysobacteraceae bacterium]|nr:MAG: RES domain-containing protein [Xanthomonadaceae bacterium]